jgi:hypothetical protein
MQAIAACLLFKCSMPVNKSALIRFMALDRCLRRKNRPCTIDGLLREVNRCLEEAGYSHSDSVAMRTLYADLKFMESEAGFAAIIVREKKNGQKFYYYEDPEFSAIGVNSSLQFECLELIAHTKGLFPFEWITERLHSSRHPLIRKRTLIQFTRKPSVSGQLWVKKLYELMREEVVVRIGLRTDKSTVNYDVHPWQIREQSGRWVLLGKNNDSSGAPILLALADVVAIEANLAITFLEPTESDWDESVTDCIESFPHSEIEPQSIILTADKNADKILQNAPLHHSQKRTNTDNGKVEFHYKLIIDTEIERQIIALGPDAYVSKPKILNQRITELITQMYRIYLLKNSMCK